MVSTDHVIQTTERQVITVSGDSVTRAGPSASVRKTRTRYERNGCRVQARRLHAWHCGIGRARGTVIGIDSRESDIPNARASNSEVTNLSFKSGDVYSMEFTTKFDIVTASRVVQFG